MLPGHSPSKRASHMRAKVSYMDRQGSPVKRLRHIGSLVILAFIAACSPSAVAVRVAKASRPWLMYYPGNKCGDLA